MNCVLIVPNASLILSFTPNILTYCRGDEEMTIFPHPILNLESKLGSVDCASIIPKLISFSILFPEKNWVGFRHSASFCKIFAKIRFKSIRIQLHPILSFLLSLASSYPQRYRGLAGSRESGSPLSILS